MRKITIVFFDAGGGHRNAAEALKTTLEQQPERWDVSLLNLQELLDSVDIVRGVTGLRTQDGYNLVLRKGWTRLSPPLLKILQRLIRIRHKRIVQLLDKYWTLHKADVVLSVIPHFNRAMAASLRKCLPEAAFVTLLTDFADYPPHFWIEPESEYLICGTERAQQQALEMGHPSSKIFEASGMILKPKFYQKPFVDKVAERKRLGLLSDVPTGVVLFGGHGSPAMVEIAKRLDQSPAAVQLIMLCGHSRKILSELKGLQLNKRIVAEGFTSNVDYYMALADFFIGKPGPGSISEALQYHLPVIVERNARTMPQERYNTEWLIEKRLGIVLGDFEEIATGVEQLLEPKTFAEFRRNAEKYSNRALFEVPVFLDKILQQNSWSDGRPRASTVYRGEDARISI
jgi:monogalactosyldiacylglycerol (MGDG) synthase/glycosyl transferase family 28